MECVGIVFLLHVPAIPLRKIRILAQGTLHVRHAQTLRARWVLLKFGAQHARWQDSWSTQVVIQKILANGLRSLPVQTAQVQRLVGLLCIVMSCLQVVRLREFWLLWLLLPSTEKAKLRDNPAHSPDHSRSSTHALPSWAQLCSQRMVLRAKEAAESSAGERLRRP